MQADIKVQGEKKTSNKDRKDKRLACQNYIPEQIVGQGAAIFSFSEYQVGLEWTMNQYARYLESPWDFNTPFDNRLTRRDFRKRAAEGNLSIESFMRLAHMDEQRARRWFSAKASQDEKLPISLEAFDYIVEIGPVLRDGSLYYVPDQFIDEHGVSHITIKICDFIYSGDRCVETLCTDIPDTKCYVSERSNGQGTLPPNSGTRD